MFRLRGTAARVAGAAITCAVLAGFDALAEGVPAAENRGGAAVSSAGTPPSSPTPSFHGCPILPADNIWNRDIRDLPVAARSAAWVQAIGADCLLSVSFCDSCKWGQRINLVAATSPRRRILFKNSQSDSGLYPFSAASEIQQGDPDRHCIMLDTTSCVLYELYRAEWDAHAPRAEFGAIFPLRSNALRRDGYSSADEAGLPIMPGVVRWDEVSAGAIRHALRFQTIREHADATPGSWLWPARHTSKTNLPHDANLPPMGARVRLRADFDLSPYSAEARVILQALKNYGALLADRGTHPFALSGSPSEHWPRGLKSELNRIEIGPYLEFVDESALMAEPNSGAARQR